MLENGSLAQAGDDQHAQLRRWVMDVFHLPETTVVAATEHDHAGEAHTEVVVRLGDRVLNTYLIARPLDSITRPDIEALRAAAEAGVLQRHPILGHLYRFFGLWFAFSGAYVLFSAQCPFCGQPGCPVGLGGAGLVGLLGTLCCQNWKGLFKNLYRRLVKRTRGQSPALPLEP